MNDLDRIRAGTWAVYVTLLFMGLLLVYEVRAARAELKELILEQQCR